MTNHVIEISLQEQTLALSDRNGVIRTYRVSSATNGPGEELDSERTPRGRHVIDEKIGSGYDINTVFAGRRPTGEIYDEGLRVRHPNRDWILTRILWLRGLEAGRTHGCRVDSKARYIYIHGSPQSSEMGIPGSHGCIRMRNDDIVDLFALVEEGTPVNILD